MHPTITPTLWAVGLLTLSPVGAWADESPADPPEPTTTPAEAPPDEGEESLEDRVLQLEQTILQLQAQLAEQDEPAAAPPQEAPALSADELAELEAELGPAEPPPTAATPARQAWQTLNPDIAIIADVALAAFSSDAPLQSGGHDPKVNGFNWQQLEMSIGGAVDPFFRLDANLVYSAFGVEIEEAYATTLALPLNMQVRAGQFLTRFGRFNPTHPHTWDFIDQPFAIGRTMGGEGNRGLGVEGSVLLPIPWYAELLGSVTMANGGATAMSFLGNQNLGVQDPADMQGTVALKQFFPLGPDVSLMWGLSWASGPNPTGRDNRTELYGTDLYLKIRPVSHGRGKSKFTLHSEWIYRRYQVPGDVLWDINGFAQVVGHFTPNLAAGFRYEYGTPSYGLGKVQVADPTTPEWTAERHRFAVNGTVWLTEFTRLRLQGGLDLPRWQDKPNLSAMLAFEFNAGSHGAHAF